MAYFEQKRPTNKCIIRDLFLSNVHPRTLDIGYSLHAMLLQFFKCNNKIIINRAK